MTLTKSKPLCTFCGKRKPPYKKYPGKVRACVPCVPAREAEGTEAIRKLTDKMVQRKT